MEYEEPTLYHRSVPSMQGLSANMGESPALLQGDPGDDQGKSKTIGGNFRLPLSG